MFRLGSGSSGHGRSKSANRKSMPSAGDMVASANSGSQSSSASHLPSSQSVPNYRELYKSKSGGEMPNSASADFKRPQVPTPTNELQQRESKTLPSSQPAMKQQQPAVPNHHPNQQQQLYDYLPSAMMRPGSRVGIADPAFMNAAAHSDYEAIQRHLHKNRMAYGGGAGSGGRQPADAQHALQGHVHHRSHSNPRSRPKSNFYEYDMWQFGDTRDFGSNPQQHYQQQMNFHHQHQQQQQPMFREPPAVPQKPSRTVIQDSLAAASSNPYHVDAVHSGSNPYASYYYGIRQQPYYGRPVEGAAGMNPGTVGANHFSLPRGQNVNLP